MKKFITMFLVLMFVSVSNVYSYDLGTDITIDDWASNGGDWYGAYEDQEVEPACATGQAWDLEGFFLNGTTLNMVGGFDFKNGNNGVHSGDIFISKGCNSILNPSGNMNGNGHQEIRNVFGYDYAFDLDFGTGEYTLYSLDPNSTLMSVAFEQNKHANAFHYVDGGIEEGTGTFSYHTGLTDDMVGGLLGDGSLGGTHNVVSLDLGDIALSDFTAHFTMGCGNDNLMGTTCPVPLPPAILLFGTGIVALVGLGRRKDLTR